jgi:hypothetical protein
VEEPRKRGGTLLLSIILVGIIGYSGYRVYPALVDLWRLAREPKEIQTTPTKADSVPATSNVDTSDVKTDAAPSAAPQMPAPVMAAPAATAPAPVEKAAPPNPSQPSAGSAGAAKITEAATAIAGAADKSLAPQKPAAPPAPSPAQLLESRLRKQFTGQPLADKVKIQATGNALTLSGSLTFAEHGELLRRLRVVPAGVRVIDDTEITEGPNATPAPASLGWIWVRSSPPGARILVDGAETGQLTPARLELQAGDHEVRLVRQGFGTAQRNVTVSQGQTMQFTETLVTE